MLTLLLSLLRDLLRPRRDLMLENLALRQQINVLRRGNPRPALRLRARLFLVVLMRTWAGWRRPLALVQPETVVGWHRKAWRLWWRRKSKPKEPGRPRVPRAAHPQGVPRILPRGAHSPGPGEEHAGRPRGRTAGVRAGASPADGGWAAQPLLSRRRLTVGGLST